MLWFLVTRSYMFVAFPKQSPLQNKTEDYQLNSIRATIPRRARLAQLNCSTLLTALHFEASNGENKGKIKTRARFLYKCYIFVLRYSGKRNNLLQSAARTLTALPFREVIALSTIPKYFYFGTMSPCSSNFKPSAIGSPFPLCSLLWHSWQRASRFEKFNVISGLFIFNGVI